MPYCNISMLSKQRVRPSRPGLGPSRKIASATLPPHLSWTGYAARLRGRANDAKSSASGAASKALSANSGPVVQNLTRRLRRSQHDKVSSDVMTALDAGRGGQPGVCG
jgi:hypothetical protein